MPPRATANQSNHWDLDALSNQILLMLQYQNWQGKQISVPRFFAVCNDGQKSVAGAETPFRVKFLAGRRTII